MSTCAPRNARVRTHSTLQVWAPLKALCSLEQLRVRGLGGGCSPGRLHRKARRAGAVDVYLLHISCLAPGDRAH